jgi:hypothetical protein
MPPSIVDLGLLFWGDSCIREAVWETSHPSEDSAALSEIWHPGIVQSSSRSLDSFSAGTLRACTLCAEMVCSLDVSTP